MYFLAPPVRVFTSTLCVFRVLHGPRRIHMENHITDSYSAATSPLVHHTSLLCVQELRRASSSSPNIRNLPHVVVRRAKRSVCGLERQKCTRESRRFPVALSALRGANLFPFGKQHFLRRWSLFFDALCVLHFYVRSRLQLSLLVPMYISRYNSVNRWSLCVPLRAFNCMCSSIWTCGI